LQKAALALWPYMANGLWPKFSDQLHQLLMLSPFYLLTRIVMFVIRVVLGGKQEIFVHILLLLQVTTMNFHNLLLGIVLPRGKAI
jgi:hypothetical protein